MNSKTSQLSSLFTKIYRSISLTRFHFPLNRRHHEVKEAFDFSDHVCNPLILSKKICFMFAQKIFSAHSALSNVTSNALFNVNCFEFAEQSRVR